MAGLLYNLARMTTATTGTGTITLGSAVSGYLTFASAGLQNGDIVSYGIKDGANSEVGTGTYTSAGTTLTRTVTTSTNSNSAISLSGSAEVYVTARAQDINKFGFSATKNATNQTGIVSGTDTKVTFTTEVFDTGGFYDAANSKWTPPAGLVMLSAQLYVTGTFTSANSATVCAVWKNGAVLKEGFFYPALANNGNAPIVVVDSANGTDFYEIYVRQSASSGTLTVDGTNKWSYFMGATL